MSMVGQFFMDFFALPVCSPVDPLPMGSKFQNSEITNLHIIRNEILRRETDCDWFDVTVEGIMSSVAARVREHS